MRREGFVVAGDDDLLPRNGLSGELGQVSFGFGDIELRHTAALLVSMVILDGQPWWATGRLNGEAGRPEGERAELRYPGG